MECFEKPAKDLENLVVKNGNLMQNRLIWKILRKSKMILIIVVSEADLEIYP